MQKHEKKNEWERNIRRKKTSWTHHWAQNAKKKRKM